MRAIADLHCDLLDYLEGNRARTARDLEIGCSIPHLKAGNVKHQTLAVFAKTGNDSVKKGMSQANIFKKLPEQYIDFIHYKGLVEDSNQISILLAFEGASTFCGEEEPLSDGLNRLQMVVNTIAKPLYIMMTWNMENRFGGGASTQIGLKEDGKALLEFMNQEKISIDLSHASDWLAHDILNFMDQENLQIPIMASHSNAREITSVPRNLPDDLAKEIMARKGIIGLNFYRNFVGAEPDESFIKHLNHFLEMGGENHVCFGADFFYPTDFSSSSGESFFQKYKDATSYQTLLNVFKKELRLSDVQLDKLANKNFQSYLTGQHT